MSNDREQIYDSFKKSRELMSSINNRISRREFKEPNFCEIVEENGKCFLKFQAEVEGINKSMEHLKNILKNKKESIKKLLRNYIEVRDGR